MTPAQATDLRDLLRALDRPLLLEEAVNPETGRVAGRDTRQRQLLRLTGAETRFDPAAGASMVRIAWRDEDALASRFCFVTRCAGAAPLGDVSLFHGNLAPLTHGAPNLSLFTDPARPLDTPLAAALAAERSAFGTDYPFGRISEATYTETPWGRLCLLPEGPLAYRDTAPGGETAPVSSALVSVEGLPATGPNRSTWCKAATTPTISLSRPTSLPAAPSASAEPRTARPRRPAPMSRCATRPAADRTAMSAPTPSRASTPRCSRPSRGCGTLSTSPTAALPETLEVIRRRAPEAYRARQLRAVTLNDYRERAEELPFVQRAAAAYDWTGSWRTVRITLDPVGGTTLDDAQLAEAAAYLNQFA